MTVVWAVGARPSVQSLHLLARRWVGPGARGTGPVATHSRSPSLCCSPGARSARSDLRTRAPTPRSSLRRRSGCDCRPTSPSPSAWGSAKDVATSRGGRHRSTRLCAHSPRRAAACRCVASHRRRRDPARRVGTVVRPRRRGRRPDDRRNHRWRRVDDGSAGGAAAQDQVSPVEHDGLTRRDSLVAGVPHHRGPTAFPRDDAVCDVAVRTALHLDRSPTRRVAPGDVRNVGLGHREVPIGSRRSPWPCGTSVSTT